MDDMCSGLTAAQRAGLRHSIAKGVCSMSNNQILSAAHQEIADAMGLTEQQYVDQVFGGEQQYFRCELETIATRSAEVGGGAGETAASLAFSLAEQYGWNTAEEVQGQLDRRAEQVRLTQRSDADDRRRQAHQLAEQSGGGHTTQEIDDQYRRDEAERGGV